MPMSPGDAEWRQIYEFAKDIARQGGKVALEYYGRTDPSVKYDMSLVTEADLAVQAFLEKRIKERYPYHRFMGEEQSSYDVSNAEFLWVVDPVDGTAAFSSGFPVWGVAISVFHDGELKLGVFYMPVTDELYAGMGSKAELNGKPIEARVDDQLDNESVLLTYSRFHHDFRSDFPGKIRSMGSSVAHIAYVARGAAWGSLLGRVHLWDVAPGLAILKAAGGDIRDLDGNPFDPAEYFDGRPVDRVFLAAAKGQHSQLVSHLHSLDE